jgi:O-glycosyl hydrolase
MGVVPKWMGEEIIRPEMEDEYIEMLVSFFYYGINKRHIRLGLISHMNEPDIRKEGPTVKPDQYATILSKFIKRMQGVGLTGIRYVGPDVAGMGAGIDKYMPLMMKDTVIMNNLSYIGLHSYAGYYAPVDSTIKKSAYPDTKFWITEWNEWCNGCDDGKIGVYDFNYASKSVRHLIDLLQHGASSCIVWEGFDSYYEHHVPSPFSYWGVLKYDKDAKTYTPRKHFYAISQISRFLTPGSVRIGTTEPSKDFFVIAIQHSDKRVSILGINLNDKAVSMNTTLENLPGIKRFSMSHTSASTNFQKDADVKVKRNKVNVVIPANAVFALTDY